MAIEIELHPAQSGILRCLLFSPSEKFSRLNTHKLESDHFTFHINRLVEIGLISKNSQNKYELTPKGKEFANRFDTDNLNIERQAKIGVLVVAVNTKIKPAKYLAQQRLKQPYFGFWGFVTGKIRWGETVLQAAARELSEETGLQGKLKLVGIRHKMDYQFDGILLEDKYFYVVKATQLTGKLIHKYEGGKNQWFMESEIKTLPDLFEGVDDSLKLTKSSSLRFIEKSYRVKKY